jgi:serpin B
MAYVLEMAHLQPDQINLTYKELVDGLTGIDDKVTMNIANSIWYRQGFDVEQGFLAVNQQYYGAEVSALDFNSPDALNIINGWVAEHTNNKIPGILNQINPEDVMFLINAIYFYGTWTKEFNPESTHEADFMLHDGSGRTVEMMALKDTMGYLENDLFQLAELDYGRGNYSMVVLLPKYGLSAEELTAELSNSNWDNWISSISQTELTLSLPKFTFGYEKKLNDILTLMGMGIAFDPWGADFTGINANGGLYISLVKHKTYIEVTEEGTEASAVTVVGVALTTANPGPVTPVMTVDRPFLFAIREKTTNAIVFIGKVAEPKTE